MWTKTEPLQLSVVMEILGWYFKSISNLIVNYFIQGAEDLKGHVMKLRGDMMKSNRNCEHEAMTIQVTIEQAEHELKYGDPQVSCQICLVSQLIVFKNYFQKAYDYLGRALSIRPDRIDCLVLRGRCLIELSRYKYEISLIYKYFSINIVGGLLFRNSN